MLQMRKPRPRKASSLPSVHGCPHEQVRRGTRQRRVKLPIRFPGGLGWMPVQVGQGPLLRGQGQAGHITHLPLLLLGLTRSGSGVKGKPTCPEKHMGLWMCSVIYKASNCPNGKGCQGPSVAVGTFLSPNFSEDPLSLPRAEIHQLEKDLCHFRFIRSVLLSTSRGPGTTSRTVTQQVPALLQSRSWARSWLSQELPDPILFLLGGALS